MVCNQTLGASNGASRACHSLSAIGGWGCGSFSPREQVIGYLDPGPKLASFRVAGLNP